MSNKKKVWIIGKSKNGFLKPRKILKSLANFKLAKQFDSKKEVLTQIDKINELLGKNDFKSKKT